MYIAVQCDEATQRVIAHGAAECGFGQMSTLQREDLRAADTLRRAVDLQRDNIPAVEDRLRNRHRGRIFANLRAEWSGAVHWSVAPALAVNVIEHHSVARAAPWFMKAAMGKGIFMQLRGERMASYFLDRCLPAVGTGMRAHVRDSAG